MKRLFNYIFIVLLLSSVINAEIIKSPENTFGFKMGSDKKLIDWTQITGYFRMLGKISDKIIVKEPGKTTLGKPFIYAIISSAANLKNIKKYREIQKSIANPYNLNKKNAESLIEQGKAVVLISLNIHSTEIASSQESVELAYELVTNSDEKTLRILNDVIIILIPSLNPDGQQIITDWYRKNLGTESEGSNPPWLYHFYAGHDNNRDWFMFNLQESRLTSKILYHEWFPQIVYDQHQMGSTGPRLFIPPYSDPINPNVDSLLMAEVNMLGKHVVTDLTEKGFKGISNTMRFNAYFQGTMSKTPLWHNMVGILSEMASANIATPVYLPPGSLGTYSPGISKYSRKNDFLKPWPGGWWKLRDIIDYEKAVTCSILDLASKYRKKFIRNFYNLNRKSIEKGKKEKPFGVLIPSVQHDPGSAATLLKKIRINGAKIYKLTQDTFIEGKNYKKGSFVIPYSQPCRPFLKDIFEIQRYPNLKAYPGGPPVSPYDVTGWTLHLQMGVNLIHIKNPLKFKMRIAEKYEFSVPEFSGQGKNYFTFERRFNRSFNLLNELLNKGINVFQSKEIVKLEKRELSPGDFIVKNIKRSGNILKYLSAKYSVPVYAVNIEKSFSPERVNRKKISIYHSWTVSMDEGWTRLVLDMYGFKYRKIYNKEIIKGDLIKKSDVLIIPDLSTKAIVEGKSRWDDYKTAGSPKKPLKYRGGIGDKGTAAILEFIKAGGTLITMGRSSDFVIKKLKVPAYNIIENVQRSRFYSPGSLLRINLDLSHPISYGMKREAVIRSTNSPVFRLLKHNQLNQQVGYYGEENPLASGWLIGWEKLPGNTALADIRLGKGRVIMFGFRVQSRGQTFGTFKLLFNSIYLN